MNKQVVLITGGSQGYGKAAAKLFAGKGAKVVIAARMQEPLEQAARETGSDSFIVMDVTASLDWQSAKEHIMQRYGRLDVLINNAGGGVRISPITAQEPESIRRSIELNLTGAIYGAQAFADVMIKQHSGTIINIASVCAKHAWPGWSVYAAAKWGLLGFSKNLYVDLQPHGIRVTCIIPGAGATDFMQRAGMQGTDNKLMADDVANAMLYVCSQPPHVVIEEMTVWGADQIVIPL